MGDGALAVTLMQAQQEAPAAIPPGATGRGPAAHTAAASAASYMAADAQWSGAQRPAEGRAAKWPILREGDGGREVRTAGAPHRHLSVLDVSCGDQLFAAPRRSQLERATSVDAPSGRRCTRCMSRSVAWASPATRRSWSGGSLETPPLARSSLFRHAAEVRVL